MSKKIVYTANDNGVDGKEKTNVIFATFNEDELKIKHEADINKNWITLGEEIVEVDSRKKQALSKLDGIDKLVLGIDDEY